MYNVYDLESRISIIWPYTDPYNVPDIMSPIHHVIINTC